MRLIQKLGIALIAWAFATFFVYSTITQGSGVEERAMPVEKQYQSESAIIPNDKRFLIVWPTIPVPLFKGSDSRVMNVIQTLVAMGFEVDVAYFINFGLELKEEMGVVDYDDTNDRKYLQRSGIRSFFGPFERDCNIEYPAESYYGLVYWIWPSIGYLTFLDNFLPTLRQRNPLLRMVAVIDDEGVMYRPLLGMFNKEKFATVKKWVVAARPAELVGSDSTTAAKNLEVDSFTQYNMDAENRMYGMADVLVGIDSLAADFMKLMAPYKPTSTLGYVAKEPVSEWPPLSKRKDYLFVGYNNGANNRGIKWFVDHVIANIPLPHTFHIAGMAGLDSVCECDEQGKNCKSYHHKVTCHGHVSDEELEELLLNVRVAINPALENSGVATKTCLALAHGTPVVTTDFDGTYKGGRRHPELCKAFDAVCFTRLLAGYLDDTPSAQQAWKVASDEGPKFIREYFSWKHYRAEWEQIIQILSERKRKIVIHGNAKAEGESMASQTWHIAKELAADPENEVIVLGELSPAIPTSGGGKVLSFPADSEAFLPTGFRANVVLRQNWPPPIDTVPLAYCNVGCRVASIIPWEFGTLPKEWVFKLKASADEVWAVSNYNAKVLIDSSIDADRVSVLPCGIDCGGLSKIDLPKIPQKADSGTLNFFFSGGLLPRKGIDILLSNWKTLFCGDNSVKLTVHTSYGLGYTAEEKKDLEVLAESCKNVEWLIGKWMTKKEYNKMLSKAHVYLAPFRSEGFGLPQVEAMATGRPMIATTGGTAADDYLNETVGFPIKSTAGDCLQAPCKFGHSELCVWGKCAELYCEECKELVRPPSWFEPDQEHLRKRMKEVVKQRDEIKKRGEAGRELVRQKFCWNVVGETLRRRVADLAASPGKREFKIPVYQGDREPNRQPGEEKK